MKNDRPRHGVMRESLVQGQPRRLQRPDRTPRAVEAATAPLATARAPLPAPAATGGVGTQVPAPAAAPAAAAVSSEAAREAAYQQGLRDGAARADEASRLARAEADKAAAARLAQMERAQAAAAEGLAKLERLVQSIGQAAQVRLTQLEDDAIAAAYAGVCRMLGEQGGQPEFIAGLVRQALSQVRHGPVLRVRLAPRDLDVLMSSAEGQRLRAGSPQIEWQADDGVDGGGCLVEAASGTLDAQLRTQLESLRELWSAEAAGPAATNDDEAGPPAARG